MRALYNMNMRYATLFPDRDGRAGAMAYERAFHWSYDPYTMKSHPGFSTSEYVAQLWSMNASVS